MSKIDFITLSNIIFKDKSKYKFVTDQEKEDNFFKLNRKFAYAYLKQAQFFNNKNIDKSEALDIWYHLFYNKTKDVPNWWWKTKQTKNTKIIKSEFSDSDIKLIKSYYNINDNDINFLIHYYSEKMKNDILRIKKFSLNKNA